MRPAFLGGQLPADLDRNLNADGHNALLRLLAVIEHSHPDFVNAPVRALLSSPSWSLLRSCFYLPIPCHVDHGRASRLTLPPERMIPIERPGNWSGWSRIAAKGTAAEGSTSSLARSQSSLIALMMVSSCAVKMPAARAHRIRKVRCDREVKSPSATVSGSTEG